MKKLIFLTLGFCALSMTACMEKEFTQGPKKNSSRVEDLKASADFNWETSDEVTFNIESSTIAQVSVAQTASGAPFATFFAGGGLEPVALNIPAAAEQLYMTYTTASGRESSPKAVQVVDAARTAAARSVDFAPGQDKKAFDDTEGETVNNVVYMPAVADGWGTMMFEDMWPSYGDYDFNDFVFNYKVQLYLADKKNRVEAMRIGIRMKAKSGSLPYNIYLRLTKLKASYVESVETESFVNTAGDKSPELIEAFSGQDKDKGPIFRFDGIYGNQNKPAGAMWINTEPGYELSEDQLVTAIFVVYFTDKCSLSAMDFSSMDFFLAQEENGQMGREIHRCNFEPINRELYYSALNDNQARSRGFYKSQDNLIWGVNIPTDVPHVYEKTDFLKAYPGFATWVESTGRQSKDWYVSAKRNSEHLVGK